MSSTLASFVPVLDGTNYQAWVGPMQSYLMAQGQWVACKNLRPVAATKTTTTTNEDGETITIVEPVGEESAKATEEFEEKNSKAVGNIRLRLHHTIAYQFNDVEYAKTLWDELKKKFGQPGISSAFLKFKGAMNVTIPDKQDPSPALSKIMSHFIRLKEIGFEIPDNVQVMMLIAKAPPSMEVIVQAFCADKDLNTLSPS